MKIDVTERIETAKRLTREWAERAGYKQPPVEEGLPLSKKANDLRRILAASSFGCQARNVHAIVETLLGEKIPAPKARAMAEYVAREPFAIGSVLVPVSDVSPHDRAGVVIRVSGSGNAGLRKSNGELHNNHYQQHDLRPASDDEIDAYFSEFFGLSTNAADMPAPGDEVDEDSDIPF